MKQGEEKVETWGEVKFVASLKLINSSVFSLSLTNYTFFGVQLGSFFDFVGLLKGEHFNIDKG